jgi:2-polyprenyl-6-methoxyphenol hydroxylase-like FAD-dependent oxidoreductase
MSANPSPSGLILVVGAGPVGLTMAAHLHHHGLPCRLIDRSPAPSDKSKALVVWARTLEMLENLDIVAPFLTAGMFLNAARLYGNGKLLVEITFGHADTAYTQPLMLAQSETERLLIEHLERVGIQVERQVELTDLVEQNNYVLATLRHADGREEQVRCDRLVGCDGAHSTVRKKLGLEFGGATEPSDFILADIRVEGPIPHDQLSLFWHARGLLVFFPFGTDRYRVIGDMGSAQASEQAPTPSLAEVQAVVDERGPGGVRLTDPVWLAGFRINDRKVKEYRKGRVFLAGDAAHIHSPAGGQGMNTGMQDTWNLAWKLALVQAGRAHPSLLDSYSPERSAVGEMVLRNASRLTWLATMRNPIIQFIRNQVVSLAGQTAGFRRFFTRTLAELTVHYPNSPLNGESGIGWTSSGVRPGDRFPDGPLLEAGTNRELRLLPMMRGTTHNLLLLPAPTDANALPSLRDIEQRIRADYEGTIRTHLIVSARSLPAEAGGFASIWLDPEETIRRNLGARETALALVRPDGYLGYRSQPASWEPLRAHLDRYLKART